MRSMYGSRKPIHRVARCARCSAWLRELCTLSSFYYEPDRERIVQVEMNASSSATRTYIDRYFERVVRSGGATEYRTNVYAGDSLVAVVKNASLSTIEWRHTDHLGSTDAITNTVGDVIVRMSFDAWGRRRNPSGTDASMYAFAFQGGVGAARSQGFTGHTSLDHLELVHMGGRMYDPVLGRFLSPDPYVQFPESIQGFNRYTYVNNNPLSYVDPSGYFLKKIGKWVKRVVKNVGQWGARLGKKVWGVIKPFVGMIVAMIPIPGINIVGLQIAISAALGAGLQAAINGGSMEQVFIAAALGFTAGYAGSIIGADKLAHAMSGQPLFATGSAPGVLSYRVPEGGGWSLARMWPAIAANFGTKMAEGIVEGDGSDPTYKPAPPELIETRDYYIWRNANAPTRIRGNNYYTNYGLRKFDEFQRLRESASPELREFIDRASVELQLSLEDALRSNPRLELSRKRLAQAAFDMHSDAYVAAGFKSLSIGDKARVGWTGGKDIFGEGIGVGICEIWQTIR